LAFDAGMNGEPVPDPDHILIADPSHALMREIPSLDEPAGELVGDVIAACVIEDFPARL